MPTRVSRRDALRHIGAASAGLAVAPRLLFQTGPITVGGRPVEVTVWGMQALGTAPGDAAAPDYTAGRRRSDASALRCGPQRGRIRRRPAGVPNGGSPGARSCRRPRRPLHRESTDVSRRDEQGRARATSDARRDWADDVVPAAEGTAARPGRRRTAVRSQGLDRSDAQRPGRATTSRTHGGARADPVARRHRRLGDVHPSAVRRVRLHAAPRACSRHARRRALPLDVFVVAVERSGRHHARVRAHHRPAGDAAALDARLPAVASHARGPRRDPRRSRARSARRSCRATR